jgi:Predicted AAA-ATPase/PD-(D/E)XK nuclease superfamily
MKKIPYGESYFPSIIRDDSFFVDKTNFITLLEKVSKLPVFLRPRRFGKSLWCSILQHYYGLEHANIFQEIFGNLYIGQNPTPLANKYLVLFWDFSGIDTSSKEQTYSDFLSNVRGGVGVFLSTYSQFFSEEDKKTILQQQDPGELIKSLFFCWKKNQPPFPIYIIIDEYDHFANTLLAFRVNIFREIVEGDGFVRKFYETIKTATQSGIVDRTFITGVSPITLDSLTSGFNITTALTTNLEMHDMLGFTKDQTIYALQNAGATEDEIPEIMADLKHWYNGYRFNVKAKEALYNSDMVLYFMQTYCVSKSYPEPMLDINIASDFGKIRQNFKIGGREQENREVLKEILETGYTTAQLTPIFSLQKGFSPNDLKSLLFYLGHLTIDTSVGATLLLKVPNQVIRDLYWNYFADLVFEDTNLVVNTGYIESAITALTLRNDPYPLIAQVENTLACLSVRDDPKFDEKHLKAIFVSFLSLSKSYLLRSEFETQRTFVDVMLLRRKPFIMPHQFAFELKYRPKAGAKAIKTVSDATTEQLQGYLQTEELTEVENLRAWVIVFVGAKAKFVKQL